MATNPNPKRERRAFRVDGGLIVGGTLNAQGGGQVSGQLDASSGTLSAFAYAGAQTQNGTVTGGTYAGAQTQNGTVTGGTYAGAQTQNGTVTGGTYAGTPTFSVGVAVPHGTAAPTFATNGQIGVATVGGTIRMYARVQGTTYWVDVTSGTV